MALELDFTGRRSLELAQDDDGAEAGARRGKDLREEQEEDQNGLCGSFVLAIPAQCTTSEEFLADHLKSGPEPRTRSPDLSKPETSSVEDVHVNLVDINTGNPSEYSTKKLEATLVEPKLDQVSEPDKMIALGITVRRAASEPLRHSGKPLAALAKDGLAMSSKPSSGSNSNSASNLNLNVPPVTPEVPQEEQTPPPPTFLEKVRGVEGAKPPPLPAAKFVLQSGLGGLLSIGVLSALHYGAMNAQEWTLILGSMGATAVLLFAAPAVPFSQPRNVIGGHIISAFVGVTALKMCAGNPAYALPIACAGSIMAMQITNTVHPPAGGTTLIAVAGNATIINLGYGLLVPTALGSSLMVATAVLYNNSLRGGMRYPQYWF